MGATTRRQLLKAMTAGSFLAVGGGLLSSCNSGGGGGAVDVTLTTHDNWPFGPMPSKEEQKENPSSRAYAETLRAWMKDNPGVKIKDVALDVWTQETLTTAITGGTAPTAFPGDVIGGWDRAKVRGAMAQGLVADVTEHLTAHDLDGKLAEYAKPIWEKWAVDGRFYAAPWLYNVGVGLHYRIDLIRERGLKEPVPDWTWEDVRELAKGLTDGKRKGIALQGWGLNNVANADGMDFHANLPAPDTGWNWVSDYTSMADDWVRLIELMRGMVFEDKSVFIDLSMTDADIMAAFARGDVAMHNNSIVYFTLPPGGDPPPPVTLSERLGKPYEEVFGWMTLPNGTNGRNGATQGQVDLVGFSPDAEEDELDKAVSLLFYMHGPGWVASRKAVYEETKDAKRVYDVANIMPLFAGNIDKVPGSPEEAWGKPFMDQVRRAAATPLVPNNSWYFPAEQNAGPGTTPRDDMTSRWANERGALDIRADLRKLEDNLNQQAASFTSSIPDEEFIAGAKEYFQAHSDYWETNAPEYYQNVFKRWYESRVLPALEG